MSSLYLDAFYACARQGHFTRAAGDLSITQSALSQRIAKLEEELGTHLFVRGSGQLRLTAAGLELLRYCQLKDQLERESLENLRGKSSNALSGVIRIGGFSSVMRSVVLPCLQPLLLKNPHLKLQVLTKEMDELPGMIRSGEVDYVIHYREILREELSVLPLGIERNVLVEKKGYDGPEIFLDHDENDQTTVSYLKTYFPQTKKFERRYLDDVYGLIDGVRLGLGRAVLPRHLISKLRDIKIVRPKNYLDFSVNLHFLKQPFYSQLHEQVVKHLKNAPKFLG